MCTTEHFDKILTGASQYPYIVGVSGPMGFGTGTLISSHFVLTCNHVLDHGIYSNQPKRTKIMTSQGSINAAIKCVDRRFDLALIELTDPISCQKLRFADDKLKSGMTATAVGVQEHPGYPDQLVIAETKMKCLNINAWNGEILDIQLEGGARSGYSGGPLIVQPEEDACCIGLISAGTARAATTLAIGLARIRAFIVKHLPSVNLMEPPLPKP